MKMTRQDWEKYGWAVSMAAWTVLGSGFITLSIFFPSAGTVFLIAYGAFSLAGVFGFMLGLRGVNPDGSSTHLQHIADWLTKLLLGAGLVELKAISTSTWQLAKAVGISLDQSLGPFIVLFIFVGLGALGLITGYLWSQFHYGTPEIAFQQASTAEHIE